MKIIQVAATYGCGIAFLLLVVNAIMWALTEKADKKYAAAMRMLACGVGAAIFAGLYFYIF